MISQGMGFGNFQLSYDGAYESNLDDKNRVVIPKRMRDGLGSTCVLFLNELGVISVYSAQNWLNRIAGMANLDRSSLAYGDLTRMISSFSFSDVPIDGGRVVLPEILKKRAGIEGRVLVCGCFDRCEIWSPESFEEYQNDIFSYQEKRRETFKRLWDEIDAAANRYREAI